MLRDLLTQSISLHAPTVTKATDTNIEQVTYPTLIGTISCKADQQMDSLVNQASNNQEGQMKLWDILCIEGDLTGLAGFTFAALQGYRITLPTGTFGKVIKWDRVVSPGFITMLDTQVNIEVQEYQGS